MSCLIIGIGIYAVVEIRVLNKSSKELFNDRMIPMDQLGDVRYFTSVVIATAHQTDQGEISFKESLNIIESAQDSITANWKNYSRTSLTPQERQMVVKITPLLNKSSQIIDKLQVTLQKQDKVALTNLVNSELKRNLYTLEDEVSNLLKLQVQVGKRIYRDNSKVYGSYVQLFYWTLFIVLVLALPFSYYIIRKNARIINSFNLGRAKLHLTEDNYRNLIEYAGEAILILNQDTEIIDVNELACTLLGYDREELLKMQISDLIASEDVKKQKVDITKARKNRIALLYRKVKRKDGSYIETEITNRVMEGRGFFSIIRDITERNKNELAIKESEAKYRYLFNNSPAYIIIWDLETLKILEINDNVLQKYGYSKEEWQKMTVLDYRPKEEYERIKEFARFMQYNDEPITKRYWRHYKKNGEEMLMEIASHKIVYNHRKAILSLANDVTEKVKAEERLAEREAQLQLFIEHSPASLAMLDQDLKYIVTSKRWITDYNLSNQEIIGKSHYEVFPEIGDEWKRIHQHCLKGFSEKKDEDTFIRADGSVDWLRWEIHPWYKANGEVGGLLFFTEVITERKKATELFKNQFENSPDIILYINKFYKIEAINRGNPEGKSKEELVGADCIAVLPEESRELVRRTLEACFKTGEKKEIENTLTQGRWVRSRLVPLKTNDEVTHILIFATDITERKKAEEQLMQSEEKYRALTENISDAIVLVDEQLRITFHSPSAEQISGYRYEDVASRSIFDFVYPEDLEIAKAFLTQVLRAPNEPINNQFRVIHKSGKIIWVEGTALNLLDNKNIRSIIINYRDITNRKILEEQQAYMVSIVNTSDDAIISESLEGTIISWNKGAERLLGYAAQDTIGNSIAMLIPDFLKGEELEILNQIQKGSSIDHYETQRRKKNGEIIYVSLTISPIKDATGQIIGASKIMRDISERKKFEDDLIHYNEELKKTNSELDRFVYSASHDLRAPLKSMLGLIDITKNELEESADCDKTMLTERFEMLNRSVTKLDNFIEDILNYSRNARLELESNEIDFKNLIYDIHANFLYSQTHRAIDFIVQDNSKSKFVSDAKRLTVILNNILSNAYKYCDTAKETSFIKVTFDCDDQWAKITIEDNGIGIPDTEKDKIFDMFYRSTILSTGSGLGLYIVKETLQKLNGTIKVTSTVPEGTTFYIEIPNQLQSIKKDRL
ncbi:PAS domain S-box protein [Flavobacterium silvisoli]|uniref:PAS domain S-box protein n=1 Tax=Flavobacterium silvisoli TaxID=2529433 RepID=UPI001F021C38|nr:PAS domain S-box protein [Flavobacterium silvisoli]